MAQYYLKHDIDAFSDPKVIKLRMLHGFEAYGIYWRILEMLFSEPEYAMKYKGTTFQLIEFETRTTLNVKEVIDTCVEIELLEIDSTGEFFYSPSLNRRMKALDKYRQEQSERGRKGAEARWGTNDTSIAEVENSNGDTVTSGNKDNGDSMAGAINNNSDSIASAINNNATAMAKNGNKIILDKTKLNNTKEDNTKEDNNTFINHPPSANKKSDLKRLEADFDRFWQIYPRKIARKKAKEDWLTKHKPSAELAEQIIHAVEQQKRTIWKNEDQQFIPHATTWLNQGRWEDELPKQKTHVGNFTVSDQSEKQIEEYQKEREATRHMTNAERSKYLYQKKLESEGLHG